MISYKLVRLPKASPASLVAEADARHHQTRTRDQLACDRLSGYLAQGQTSYTPLHNYNNFYSHGPPPPPSKARRSRRPLAIAHNKADCSPTAFLLWRSHCFDRLHHLCRWPTPRYECYSGLERAERRCYHRLDLGSLLAVGQSDHVRDMP